MRRRAMPRANYSRAFLDSILTRLKGRRGVWAALDDKLTYQIIIQTKNSIRTEERDGRALRGMMHTWSGATIGALKAMGYEIAIKRPHNIARRPSKCDWIFVKAPLAEPHPAEIWNWQKGASHEA